MTTIFANALYKNLESYYYQRTSRLRNLTLTDILLHNSFALWSPVSTSAPEIVARLIEHYLASFETEWQRQIQNRDFCSDAILAREHVDVRLDYEPEFARAHNRLTLAFINQFCKPDGAIDWEKLLRFNSGKD